MNLGDLSPEVLAVAKAEQQLRAALAKETAVKKEVAAARNELRLAREAMRETHRELLEQSG